MSDTTAHPEQTATSIPQARQAARIHGLDLLRGVCAIFVATYHFMLWQGYGEVESLGTFPVYTFFVLSALTISHIYQHKFSEVISKRDLYVFLYKRMSRVLPLLAIVALVMALLRVAVKPEFDIDVITRFIMTATGAFAFHMPALMSNTIGAWSLGIEFVFYILFPIVALLMPKQLNAKLFLIFGALVLLQLASIHKVLAFEPEFAWYSFVMPVTFAPFFLGGMLILYFKKREQRGFALAAMVCLCVMSFWSLITPVQIGKDPVLFTALMGLSIAAVYFSYNCKLSGIGEKIAHEVGRLSYPLYLTHWFSFQLVSKLGGHLALEGVALWVVFFGVAMGVAHVANILCEMPMQRYLNGRLRQRSG